MPPKTPSDTATEQTTSAATRQNAAGRGPSRRATRARRWLLGSALALLLLVLLAGVAARLWLQHITRAALPQIDGSLHLPGITAPVRVLRDARGVPSIQAASLDDLVVAQGYITAQDRLFQLDTLRRHAAGELAEILGPQLIEHDRLQRVLQIRAAADRALAALPPDQLHWLELYAVGVNAAMRAQATHPPVELRLLGYTPRPWTPRDSVLVGLVMFQDLTNSFPTKLNREALEARLDPHLLPELRQQLLTDLYPVGSWQDHPPGQPVVDLTQPTDPIPDIPLDPSQTRSEPLRPPSASPADLLRLAHAAAPACAGCRAGSNNWAVAGAHTATGAPLLSNDMHLTLGVPGLWYQVDLQAPQAGDAAEPFHVSGISLPGTPFCIVGHTSHVAWGFTSLGADVQDLYLEHLRGSGTPSEFELPDGTWQPLLHQRETIRVRGGRDLKLDVLSTVHGGEAAPLLTPLLPSEQRPIALRWSIYHPANVTLPFFPINRARSGPELVAAFTDFGGPPLNLIYADDHNHIGYHAIGRVPVRGSLTTPAPLSPVPTDVLSPAALAHEWAGYIPFDRLPQVVDPPLGVLATANARITPEGYRFPITLDWADPFRNERLWKLLSNRTGLTPADMLAIQTDIHSEPDRLIAQRLAYALDHASSPAKRLRQAADLLRSWDGRLTTDSPAAAITVAARTALWPLLLTPKLQAGPAPATHDPTRTALRPVAAWELYNWGERTFAEEQLVLHTPTRWLPSTYASWNDLLAAAVAQGLTDGRAPANLASWHYGAAHPVDLEHPLFAQLRILRLVFGLPTGTGVQEQSGDGITIKQVGRTFGPSERFTADLADPDRSTLNLVLGESGNPASPWFLDQFPAWLNGTTFPAPFTAAALRAGAMHTLTLEPAR